MLANATKVLGDGSQSFILFTERLMTELADERNHSCHLRICPHYDNKLIHTSSSNK